MISKELYNLGIKADKQAVFLHKNNEKNGKNPIHGLERPFLEYV